MLVQRVVSLPSNPRGALMASMRAMATFGAPIWVSATLAGVISIVVGWILPMVLSVSVLMFLVGVAVHEVGHTVTLRLLSPSTRALFCVSWKGAGVHRPPLASRWREIVVVLTGPMAPAGLWTAAMGTWQIATGEIPMAALVWTGVFALSHPLSLLVPVGDARILLEALTLMRSTRD